MNDKSPVILRYDGEGAFAPSSSYWSRKADERFVIGQTYKLDIFEERSRASHDHFFAALTEGHANLPQRLAEQFPTVESLRKYALIKTGFHDSHSLPCHSRAEALKVASYIRPIDEFAVVTVQGTTVIRYTAKSQSARAMGKEEFQRSKTAILELVSDMIGVKPRELEKAHAA